MTQADAQSASHSALVRPAANGGFALGLGLTNECNLACSFCYRDPARTDRLSLEQVRSVMESLPFRSVNLGTGENGMHPQFREILAYLRTQPVKLTITSNGHSAAVLTDDELRAFHDVEFSSGNTLMDENTVNLDQTGATACRAKGKFLRAFPDF